MRTVVLMMAMMAGMASGQTSPQTGPTFYRLDFVLKQNEGGKAINTRNYQMMVRTDDNAMSSIRSGGRVPVATDRNGSVTYIDVGVNIDVKRLTRVQDELMMDVIAEASGTPDGSQPGGGMPTVGQNRWTSTILIPLRKPVLVFSSDDPTSKKQLQLEVTATPIK